MSTRRAAFKCSTSTAANNRSGQAKISKPIRRKSIEYRLTNTAFVISVVCVMFGTGLAASAKNTAGEIDKVYGRPNIEPSRPSNPAAYRRSSDSQLKGTNNVGAALYYSSHLPFVPSNAVGYAPPVPSSGNYVRHAPSGWDGNYAPPPSPTENYVPPSVVGNYASHIPPNTARNYVPPILTGNYVPPSPTENYSPPISNGHYAPFIAHTGPFRYLDNKGCVKSVQHVHWPSLKYALRYYDKHYTVQPPAYTPDENPPIHVNKKHVSGDKDDKNAREQDDKKRDAKDRYVFDFDNYQQKSYENKPLKNRHHEEHGSHSVQSGNPSSGGYKKPENGDVTPSYAKAKKYDEDYAPKPAEGYGFKKLIVPIYDVYNQKAHQPPTYDLSDLIFPADSYDSPPSLPYSADGYGDKKPVDQPYDSKLESEYEPTDEIDSFGVMPYKEKKKKTLPHHLNPSSLIIREEDYAPTGRDEFGVLPYKESIGGSPKKAYQSTSPPSTDVSDNGGATTESSPPPSPAASLLTLATTSAGVRPPVTPLTADFASALAQAEKERQKLSEPGPSILCPGMRTQVGGECSPFFTCNTDGKLLSCWDSEDDTVELVFDPTSQECRKFEAIPACTKETICAGKSGLTLIGGGCTRLAFSCATGDLTKCDVPGTAVSPAGECVFNRSVDSCTSLVDKL